MCPRSDSLRVRGTPDSVVPPKAGQGADMEAGGCIVFTNFRSLKGECVLFCSTCQELAGPSWLSELLRRPHDPIPLVTFCLAVTGDTHSAHHRQQRCLSPHVRGNRNGCLVQRRVDGTPVYIRQSHFSFSLRGLCYTVQGGKMGPHAQSSVSLKYSPS